MSQRMCIRLEMIQALALCGGATDSIFPGAEALILSDYEFQKALEFVGQKKKIDGSYWSMIDFLFAELFPQYRYRVKKFYEGSGPPLRELLSPVQIFYYNEMLVEGLRCARELYRRREERRFQPMNWSYFRSQFKQGIKQYEKALSQLAASA